MKKHIQKLSFLVFSLVLILSCSKDDTDVTPAEQNGGQISRFQIVIIDFGETSLSDSTYSGTFNNQPISLNNVEDNQLTFYVNETTPLGKTELNIPALSNTKITYEVVEAVLTQTPAATLQPLVNFQTQYGSTLTNDSEDAPFLQNHNSLTAYLASLTGEDAIKAAKFYQANKTIFDAVYNTNFDAIQGKNPNQPQDDFDFQLYRSLINRHKAVVIVTVIAGFLAATPPYELIETGITTAVALVGIKKSRDYHNQIVTDVFRVIQIKLNDVLGNNTRAANMKLAPLSLSDNQLATMPFKVNAKNFNSADNAIQKEFVQKYFTSKNSLNNFINKLNSVITWVNNNNSFFTLSTIATINVPTTSPLNSFDANAQLMQRFSFSVNHPNLSLVTATLSSNGQLNLKVKFIGNPTTIPINSTLNYTYNDDFSSFSGSFPIKVDNSISLVGTWVLESFSDGVPVGQYETQYSVECPAISIQNFRFNSETIVFTSNAYSQNSSTQYVFFNKAINFTNCTVTSDSPDTQQSYNDATNGTYTINGANIVLVDPSGNVDIIPIVFLTNNKFKAGGSVYNRQ
jgi:hypothetical protein